MKTKVKLSISLKLTFIVIIVSAIAIISITYINLDIEKEKEHFLEVQFDKAASLVHDLNSSIGGLKNLENQTKLISILNDFKNWNERILEVNINRPDENGELKINASTNNNSIGNPFNIYTANGVDYSSLCYQDGNTYYIPYLNEEPKILAILSPINMTGEIIGTYEIVNSLDAAYAYLDNIYENRTRNVIFTSIFVLFFILFCFLFLLRKIIVLPITKFRDTAKVYGKGNLEARINIDSKDELGDLASAFNQMAKDLKESRDKIQDYNQILENLLQQKDEFIGQLGHDLKNPMQPLVGLLPMLIEKEKDPKIKEALEVMNQNATYMHELIHDTLNLAKLRHSNIKFDIENLNLYDLVEKVISSQRILLNENNVEIINKISRNIYVEADKLRLAEVFNNLIANSIKYKKENEKGNILIDAEVNKKDVKISFKDDGIGIKEDQIKQIFDEFYKADKFSSERKSSGLGLSICKRIIEKHGGKIWVESEGIGKGSTFYFTLKLGKGENE